MYIIKTAKSIYCQIIFVFALIAGYFLLPNRALGILEIAFIAIFAITLMCLVKNVKENVQLAKIAGKSAIPLVLYIIGVSSLGICSTSLPVCGVNIGAGIIAIIFPELIKRFLLHYHSLILAASLFLQIAYLFHLKCFSKSNCLMSNCD